MKALRWCIVLSAFSSVAHAGRAADVVELGTRRELFVDRFLIDRLDGARLEMHRPVRREVALRMDRPWEGRFAAYFTVLKDGGRYRMYYRGCPQTPDDKAVTCLAESDDGIHFTRGSLKLYEVAGTKDNNVILARSVACHNFAPFIDARPGVPAGERYKALGGLRGGGGLLAFVSADGVHWKPLRPKPVITNGAFDSQNVAFWSRTEGCYVSYFRVFIGGMRAIARATSKDFVTWSDTAAMRYGDTGKTRPSCHLYTNATHPYFRAGHIYLSFPKRFMPGRRSVNLRGRASDKIAKQYRNDCSDGVFMTTRGGAVYDRTFLEAFFRPGPDAGNWGSRCNMAARGVVPTGEKEMSIYYSQHYAQPTAHVLRCTLRLDGFASVRGPAGGGEIVTKPLTFSGSRLVLNFSTSAAGSVRVELQDAQGKALGGFALADCPEIVGDRIEHVVSWKGGADLSALAGKPVRMRLALKDADVYAFQFAPAKADKSPTGAKGPPVSSTG